jgi:nucleotide-binding universal stress UspA family protein
MARGVHHGPGKEMPMVASKPYVIVVAVDYSETGNLALERALELGLEKPSAAIHVINVLPIFESGFLPDATTTTWAGVQPTVAEATQQLGRYIDARIADFRKRHADRNLAFLDAIRAHQRIEVPSEEVAQLAADLEADLVVVGTHGRRSDGQAFALPGAGRPPQGGAPAGPANRAPLPALRGSAQGERRQGALV